LKKLPDSFLTLVCVCDDLTSGQRRLCLWRMGTAQGRVELGSNKMGRSLLRSSGLLYVGALVTGAVTVTAIGGPALAATPAGTTSRSACVLTAPTRVGHFLGIARPLPESRTGVKVCAGTTGKSVGTASPPYEGTPPLIFHTGLGYSR
jgi:hypothetical protein